MKTFGDDYMLYRTFNRKKRSNSESFVGEKNCKKNCQWQEKLSQGVFCITKMYAVICLCEIVFVMSLCIQSFIIGYVSLLET